MYLNILFYNKASGLYSPCMATPTWVECREETGHRKWDGVEKGRVGHWKGAEHANSHMWVSDTAAI